jgi:heme exporter protein D
MNLTSLSNLSPSDFGGSIVFIWLGVAVGIIIFFILIREFVCWYFKINQRIAILKKIERNSRPMKSSLTPEKKKFYTKKYKDLKDEDEDTDEDEDSGEEE